MITHNYLLMCLYYLSCFMSRPCRGSTMWLTCYQIQIVNFNRAILDWYPLLIKEGGHSFGPLTLWVLLSLIGSVGMSCGQLCTVPAGQWKPAWHLGPEDTSEPDDQERRHIFPPEPQAVSSQDLRVSDGSRHGRSSGQCRHLGDEQRRPSGL